ncbi:MAG: SufD family Fe-S cluster assembly protein [Lachnospiraceae bacterium]|nr:SufD family Fe-S cluster assembly protein [Lachnospiraceae bacterium]
MGINMTINRLPAPTWNWLHVNEAALSVADTPAEGQVKAETPDSIQYYKEETTPSCFAQIPTGLGEELDALFTQCGALTRIWEIAPGVKESEPVRLHFSYQDGAVWQNRIGILAGENSAITVVMDFCGEVEGFAAVQTKIAAGKGAKVRLVQIQKLQDGFTFLNDVGTSCGEGAQIETIQIMLGGGDTYMGMRTDLGARAARLESKIGYLLNKKESLDMNYLAYHTGAKTTSQMDVSGVLRGESKKIFRGTIDFRHGSVGAKGDEKEDVLLLSDGVANRTVPLILCEEEDVEGNHGATIGRLDESLLFYLSSRGIEEKEIYEMMARARIDALCADIADEKTRCLVQRCLG